MTTDGESAGHRTLNFLGDMADFDRCMTGVRRRATPPGLHHGVLYSEPMQRNQGVLRGIFCVWLLTFESHDAISERSRWGRALVGYHHSCAAPVRIPTLDHTPRSSAGARAAPMAVADAVRNLDFLICVVEPRFRKMKRIRRTLKRVLRLNE